MINLQDIRYVRLATRNVEAATDYARKILGLELVRREGRYVYLRGDDRDHTLVYYEGDPSETTAGFEVRSKDELEAAGAKLDELKLGARRGTREEAEQRLGTLSELSLGSEGGWPGAERRCLLLQRAELASSDGNAGAPPLAGLIVSGNFLFDPADLFGNSVALGAQVLQLGNLLPALLIQHENPVNDGRVHAADRLAGHFIGPGPG